MIHISRCCICGSSPTTRKSSNRMSFCGPCHRELSELKPVQRYDLELFKTYGIFLYEGSVKSLIRRAKIQNEALARKILSFLFLESTSLNWGEWADVIMPSPSSIWGRARGRVDLAAILGKKLAECCEKKFIYPPMRLYGRFTKKALIADRSAQAEKTLLLSIATNLWTSLWQSQEQKWLVHFLEQTPDPVKIALIDDVVTTGRTMQEISDSLHEILKGQRKLIICKIALAQSPNYET